MIFQDRISTLQVKPVAKREAGQVSTDAKCPLTRIPEKSSSHTLLVMIPIILSSQQSFNCCFFFIWGRGFLHYFFLFSTLFSVSAPYLCSMHLLFSFCTIFFYILYIFLHFALIFALCVFIRAFCTCFTCFALFGVHLPAICTCLFAVRLIFFASGIEFTQICIFNFQQNTKGMVYVGLTSFSLLFSQGI